MDYVNYCCFMMIIIEDLKNVQLFMIVSRFIVDSTISTDSDLSKMSEHLIVLIYYQRLNDFLHLFFLLAVSYYLIHYDIIIPFPHLHLLLNWLYYYFCHFI